MRKTWICLLINSRFFARTTPSAIVRGVSGQVGPMVSSEHVAKTQHVMQMRQPCRCAGEICPVQIGPHRCLVNHQWSFFSVWSITNLQDQRFWITHRYHCVGIMEYLQFGLREAVPQAIATSIIGPPQAQQTGVFQGGRAWLARCFLVQTVEVAEQPGWIPSSQGAFGQLAEPDPEVRAPGQRQMTRSDLTISSKPMFKGEKNPDFRQNHVFLVDHFLHYKHYPRLAILRRSNDKLINC